MPAPVPLDQEAICYLLAEKAREGKTVARLKWGDPFIFDSGGSEALFLHERAHPLRSGARRARRNGCGQLLRSAAHLSRWRRHADLRSRKRGHGEDPAGCRLGQPGDARRHHRLLRRAGPAARHARCAAEGRAARGRHRGADLRRHAAHAEDDPRNAGRDCSPTCSRAPNDGRPSWWSVGSRPCARTCAGSTPVRCSASASSSPVHVSRPGNLSACFEALGADPIEAPMIRIVPPTDFAPLDQACADIDQFDWAVFTSGNAVDAFMGRLLASDADVRALKNVRLCAIGAGTAERFTRFGIKVDLLPAESRAESVVQALLETGVIEGVRFLLPRADIGREVIGEELRKRGAAVEEVIAYRTVAIDPRARRRAGCLPHAARSTHRCRHVHQPVVGEELRGSVGADAAADLLHTTNVAAIGPVTAEAAAQLGIACGIVPSQYTIPALCAAIVASLRNSGRDESPAHVSTRPEGGLAMATAHARSTLTLTRRLRRLRSSEPMRALVRETRLSPEMFVLPLFVCEGEGVRREVPLDARRVQPVGRRGRAGGERREGRRRPERAALRPSRAQGRRRARRPTIRRRRSRRRSARSSASVPDVLVITDVCLCEYTDHGHCGIADRRRDRQRSDGGAARAGRASRTPRPAPTSSRRRT